MDEYYSEVPLTNSKILCIGTVTKEEAENANSDPLFSDGFGYYLFVADAKNPQGNVDVVAKVASQEAANSLIKLLSGGFHTVAA